MNRLVWLKRQYRRRPLGAIATTVAGIDISLGGLEGSVSLTLFGMILGCGGGLVVWRTIASTAPQSPQLFLPYASSHAPLIQLDDSLPPRPPG
mgnify:CR=1 FL=1